MPTNHPGWPWMIVGDDDPTVNPTPAPIGMLYARNAGGSGQLYQKTGAGNTAWSLLSPGGASAPLTVRRTLQVGIWRAGLIGADAGAPMFSMSRVFFPLDVWNDLAPASFTGRELNAGIIANAAGRPECVADAILNAGFGAGDVEVTGADSVLWKPGGSDPRFAITNGGYGGGDNADALASRAIIKNEDARSLAANRFTLPGGADIALAYGEAILFRYDAGTTRWVPVIES